jgi:hypothetical protein
MRIGAEFFLNRAESRDSVFLHFRRMADTGLTIARIFTLWDQIEHEKGTWDFTGHDWIYDAAARNGILIANTLCSDLRDGCKRPVLSRVSTLQPVCCLILRSTSRR